MASLLAACRGTVVPTIPVQTPSKTAGGSGTSAALPPMPAACGPAAGTVSTSLAAMPVADPLVTFDSAWSIIGRTHWDTTYHGVNWTAVRAELRPKAAAATTTGQLRTVLSDMVGRLNQSHFSIIPREIADATGSGSASSSGGAPAPDRSGSIGAEVRYLDRTIVIAQLDREGPAARAGVQTGWRVQSVNGCPMSARLARMPKEPDFRREALTAYAIATQALAGAVGDTATVVFTDGRGTDRTVRLARAPEPGAVAKFGNLPAMNAQLAFERVKSAGKTVGIIRFNIWMPILSPQFDAAIDSLRAADAIILDLRGNFGGVGGMSMGIAGHFLDSTRTIGTMVQRGATLKFVANPRRVDTRARGVSPFAGPLAIVVDELSISTTEIFAGGMQALGRARVFGVQTAGQALPSVPERLPNGDILYHAIADFLNPFGQPLEGAGVTPDRVVPLTREALLARRDPALDAAITWATMRREKQ
ncbi:S41 family peptidase [Gemmatimonas sp.]|uniref:S41 family peptidase n=1 Tax=Gemmatimonas sp. TaxID=1962908 RepID=UPI0039834D3D